jgi:hypothetical protein
LRFADPKAHERVAVVGIGSLGHLGIQYSKAAGFETIAVTHSKDKEELAYKLGADSVVSDGEGLLKEGQNVSSDGGSGSGADVILATSNSYKATADSIKGLRLDGRLVLMGFSTTEPFTISPEILFNHFRIIGSTQNDREHLYEELDYAARGKVRVMTEIFPLEEISNAYDKVANGNVRFKAVSDCICSIEPISSIEDEVWFVEGASENSINPLDAAACPLLFTSFAICTTSGFGSIKCTTLFVELLGSTIRFSLHLFHLLPQYRIGKPRNFLSVLLPLDAPLVLSLAIYKKNLQQIYIFYIVTSVIV